MSTPMTEIHVCSGVPLNNKYDHTLYFDTPEKQLAYFQGKTVRTYTEYAYVRKNWKLRLAADRRSERARMWSYLYFRNADTATNKWYFYFITEMEYLNENTVELTLELDVMQTYMFDWVLRPCFVEREHSETDEIGDNTLDEGLNTGDFINVRDFEKVGLSDSTVLLFASSVDLSIFCNGGSASGLRVNTVDGIMQGYAVYAARLSNKNRLEDLMWKLESEHGKTDAIFAVWHFPEQLTNIVNMTDDDDKSFQWVNRSNPIDFEPEIKAPNTEFLGGYIPKNKKLYQFPYCFLYVTNNGGGSAVYHYERFETGASFKVQGNIAPDGIVKIVPKNYKGAELNYDEGLNLSNFAMASWNSDAYTLWLAQNQNVIAHNEAAAQYKAVGGAVTAIAGLASMFTGVGTMAGLGALAGGVATMHSASQDIQNQLAAQRDMDIQPPQSRGNIGGSHNQSRGLQDFHIYHKSIDRYHAEIIDNYFSLYGYATRRVKTPNISSRPSWNYVKTVGSNVGGDFCADDLQKINTIFDRGITFWRNTDVGNYGLDNSCKWVVG